MNSLHILGAILLLSLTALNTQRHQIDVREHQMRSELEMRATVLGTRLLDHLATLPFDANQGLGDVALLTPAANFGGAATFAEAVNVDDVHGIALEASEPSSSAALTFEVTATVRYVHPEAGQFVASPTPSAHKEVTLNLTSDLGTTVSLRRVYSL